MIKAMYTSATGMKVQQTNVDVIANNLANVNTTGYKKQQVEFQDLLYLNLNKPGSSTAQGTPTPTGAQIGSGARLSAVSKLFTTGNLEETKNALNLAIEGDGVFQLRLPDGNLAYTRDGSFAIDANGQLVTNEGFTVDPAITFPQDATGISIGVDGTVSVVTASSPNTASEIGQLTLARFINPAGLENRGSNLLIETAASGTPTTGAPGSNGIGALRQGFLERSNVEVVTELVGLITAQRAYEVNSRVIRTSDNMLSTVNQIIR